MANPGPWPDYGTPRVRTLIDSIKQLVEGMRDVLSSISQQAEACRTSAKLHAEHADTSPPYSDRPTLHAHLVKAKAALEAALQGADECYEKLRHRG